MARHDAGGALENSGQMRATEDLDFLLHVPAFQLPQVVEAMIAGGGAFD